MHNARLPEKIMREVERIGDEAERDRLDTESPVGTIPAALRRFITSQHTQERRRRKVSVN